MDVKSFADELLSALADTGVFRHVSLQTEGPVVTGYAYTDDDEFFLRFYFNRMTGTLAFALIEKQKRIWGIDHDNRRGWHLHPEENPSEHVEIEALTVSEIVRCMQDLLMKHLC